MIRSTHELQQMIDELVLLSESDKDLANDLHCIEEMAKRKESNFYDYFLQFLLKSSVEAKAKNWLCSIHIR